MQGLKTATQVLFVTKPFYTFEQDWKVFQFICCRSSFLIIYGAVYKRCRNFFGDFWYPPPLCRNFYPDLPNSYLLMSCNIEIWDPPPPLEYSDVFYGWPLWWMCPNKHQGPNILILKKSNHFGTGNSQWNNSVFNNLFNASTIHTVVINHNCYEI